MEKGNISCKCFLPLCGKKDITWYVSFFISNYTLQQLSRSIRWWGTIILVAGRFGFSMWLMIWEAASLPSWPAPMSIEVNCGEVSLANNELLKDMIDRSSGIDRLFSRQTRSKETARISSLTRIAVGRSSCRRSLRMDSSLFSDAFFTSAQYSGRTGSWWLASASW